MSSPRRRWKKALKAYDRSVKDALTGVELRPWQTRALLAGRPEEPLQNVWQYKNVWQYITPFQLSMQEAYAAYAEIFKLSKEFFYDDADRRVGASDECDQEGSEDVRQAAADLRPRAGEGEGGVYP